MKVIRKRLEEGRQTNPLFDTYLFTKHLEESYRQMMHVKWVENSPVSYHYVLTLVSMNVLTDVASSNRCEESDQQVRCRSEGEGRSREEAEGGREKEAGGRREKERTESFGGREGQKGETTVG